jgi:PPOX class probable F420-dependent enzyme
MVENASFRGRYLSLTSYKRDGTAVATPVWFVAQEGRLWVQTDLRSGKVKRIRRNPVVSVALCNGLGRAKGESVTCRAEVADAAGTARIQQLVRQKYRWDLLIIGPFRWAQRTFHLGEDRGPTVGLVISPEAPA